MTDHRHRRRAPDRRRRRHRDGVRDPRPRPADGRRDPAPRLPDHPGHHPDFLGRLCAGQSPGRSQLHRSSTRASGIEGPSDDRRRRPISRSHARAGAREARCRRLPAPPSDDRRRQRVAGADGGDGGLCALARHRRPAVAGAGQAAALAVGRRTGSAPTCSAATSTAARSTARASRSTVGISVALLATRIGLAIGVVTGFSRWIDAIVMRIMDGLMSIPSVLIAIALMALTRASIQNVIFAITVAEVPRVTRLVRGVVLTLREQPFVEAAHRERHRLFPHPVAPHRAQHAGAPPGAGHLHRRLGDDHRGDPVLSSAPARRPTSRAGATSWPRGAASFRSTTTSSCSPGSMLSLTVLAINLLGDGLRDALDPRLARRM